MVYGHIFPQITLNALQWSEHLISANHLVEPRSLQDEQASFEQLQNNVVFNEHLQHAAGRSAKHSREQQGVDVSVQKGPIVHVVIEQKPWMIHKTWLKYTSEEHICDVKENS